MASRSWLERLLVRVPPPGEPAPRRRAGPRAGPRADQARGSNERGSDEGGSEERPAPGPGPRPSGEHHQVHYIAFEPTTFRRAVIFVLIAVSVWMVAVWAYHATAHFLFMLLLAWLIAIAMEPAIQWLMRHGSPRMLATGITGVGSIIVVLGVIALFGTELATQVSQLAVDGPQIVSSAVSWVNSTFHLSLDPTKISSAVNLGSLANYGSAVAQGAFGVLGTLGSVTFDALTVIVFAFYLAASGPGLLRQVGSWLPPDKQEVFATVWEISVAKTGGYVISKLVLIALSTFFHAIFFYLLGLPGWLPLALLTGVTAQLVPLIGTYIGIIAAVLVAVFVRPLDAVWVVVFATIYQQIENYVFTPRVSNRTMDVGSGIALAAVFVGIALWGPIGALIGIPVVAAVVSVLETYGHRYELVAQIADAGEGTGAGSANGSGTKRARAVGSGDEGPREPGGGDEGTGEQRPG